MFEREKPGESVTPAAQPVAARQRETGQTADAGEAAATRPSIESSQLVVQRSNVSVIGPGMVFKGDLTAGEDVVIHGRVEGTIAHRSQNVFVAKAGLVRALIHANSVTVEGEVRGDVHAEEFVELLAGSVVDGDIYCGDLRMASGARFNGTVHMP